MSESETENQSPSKVRVKNPQLLAKMVIRDGKSFKSSAVECGYAASVATRGLNALVRESSLVANAVERETNSLLLGVDKLKPLAIARLHTEISDLRRPGGLKAIEIAGRLKELDWFVRNVDVQVGIFQSLADNSSDPAREAIDAYKEEE